MAYGGARLLVPWGFDGDSIGWGRRCCWAVWLGGTYICWALGCLWQWVAGDWVGGCCALPDSVSVESWGVQVCCWMWDHSLEIQAGPRLLGSWPGGIFSGSIAPGREGAGAAKRPPFRVGIWLPLGHAGLGSSVACSAPHPGALGLSLAATWMWHGVVTASMLSPRLHPVSNFSTCWHMHAWETTITHAHTHRHTHKQVLTEKWIMIC